jgi:3-isopropylmalate/(R)-2-methylmalate dehydratase large subunit
VRGLSEAHRAFAARFGLVEHGYLENLPAGDAGNRGSQGISHAVMAEQYALPVSSSPAPIRTRRTAARSAAWRSASARPTWRTPSSPARSHHRAAVLRVELDGALPAGVTAKDSCCICSPCPRIRGGGRGQGVRVRAGPRSALATDERATLTNMTAELGGFTGIVEPDEETVRFSASAAASTSRSSRGCAAIPGAATRRDPRRLQHADADGARPAIRATAWRWRSRRRA